MAGAVETASVSACIPAVHPLAILYGSETGTAQEVAEYTAGKARRRGFNARAIPLDSVPISDIFEWPLAVFVVSTAGDGEVPSNMSVFWRFLLRRSLPPDSLKGMLFAVFGLGDSGYAKYNAAARKLHARLLQLGATELVPRGLGDDQSSRGIWGDLDPWMASLWSSLLQVKPLPEGAIIDDSPRLDQPAFATSPVDLTVATESASVGEIPPTVQDAISRGREAFWESIAPSRGRNEHAGGVPKLARLVVNRRLTADDHFQDVRHIELDVTGVPGGRDYGAGDVAWLHPCNDQSSVETFAKAMGLSLDQILRISPAPTAVGQGPVNTVQSSTAGQGEEGGGGVKENGGSDERIAVTAGNRNGRGAEDDKTVVGLEQHRKQTRHHREQQQSYALPSVCSVRFLLSEVLDTLGTPRRSFFEQLSLFARDDEEKEKLVELASPEGADLLYEYATREKRSYAEVLRDFPSCKVPIERLLELIPRLRPRGFSIASSALETPSRVHLCVAVVSFRTPYKRVRNGICSSWLASLHPGATVPLCIRPGTFKLPSSPSQPLIMVGPGTGVAPMRSVILERRCLRRRVGVVVRGQRNGCDTNADEGGGEGGLSSTQREDLGEVTTPPDTLFFGCRYREKDFLYGAAWTDMAAEGDLSLHTAFSRQNPDPRGGRVYVQRRIREQSERLSPLIVDGGACVLVSGSAKQMPRDVREALRDAIATHSEVDGEAGAEAILKSMERKGRYCVEAWS